MKWAQSNNAGVNLDSILKSEGLKKFVLDDMMKLAAANKFSSLEKPRDIFVTMEQFTPENNLMTPTFKLKRNVVRDHYRVQIDAMYEDLAKKGF